MGLTATPERSDGRESVLDELIGPVVYRRDIVELSGDFLADYDVVRVPVHLTPEEREEYESERGIYRSFIARSGIRMSQPDGWSKFIMLTPRSAEGRDAGLSPAARARAHRAGEARLGRPSLARAPQRSRSASPAQARRSPPARIESRSRSAFSQ